jgi:hypothetical protein
MKMKFTAKNILSLLLVAVGTLATTAQDGTTAYQFLDVPVSSHVYALGGHNITVIDDDINLVEQNPSLLGKEFDHQVGLNYMRYIGGTNFMGARYGQGVGEHGAFGVGIQYYGYGKMDETDVSGAIIGSFSASDLAVTLTYSHDISDRLRGGINLKYIHSSYETYSAGAIAADLGINYYDPDKELSLSLVAKNLGGQVKKFNDMRDKLPWDIQLGFSKGLGSTPFRLSVTAFNLTKWKSPYYEPADKNNVNSDLVEKEKFASNLFRHLVFGLDYLPTSNVYIAAGYNYKTRTDMSTYKRNFLSGFSIGGGMKVKAFGFGVAFAQPHTGATTFMVNLTTSIGELMR